MQLRIKLKSDFCDYYDHHFAMSHEELSGQVLWRMSSGGLTKRNQFKLFDELRIKTPVHGVVRTVVPKLKQSGRHSGRVVVYTNEDLHAGDGKLLVPLDEAIANYRSAYCSAWIPTSDFENQAVTFRLLQIGWQSWWLQYSSAGDWRSNYGDRVTVSVVTEAMGYWAKRERNLMPLAAYPIFAIDFVVPVFGTEKLAIDFNASPGLKNTGMEDILKPRQVYDLIAEWMFLYTNDPTKPST